jgi:hypothetical protein
MRHYIQKITAINLHLPPLKNWPEIETSYGNGKDLRLLEFPLEIRDGKHSRKLEQITVFKTFSGEFNLRHQLHVLLI